MKIYLYQNLETGLFINPSLLKCTTNYPNLVQRFKMVQPGVNR